jgi:hypothetical protein
MLATPTRALAYGIAGRDRVLARYGWDRVADSTLAVYEEVVAERAGLPAPGTVDEVADDQDDFLDDDSAVVGVAR